MTDKNLQRVFAPFERLHSDTVRGTGLGLAICSKVCEAHGWRIEVESEKDKGSRFLIQVPASSVVNA